MKKWIEQILILALITTSVVFIVSEFLDIFTLVYANSNRVTVDIIKISTTPILAICAIWGIIIAINRQKTFRDQLFNEKLGQGIELLTNQTVIMRVVGMRILEDLISSSNLEQTKLIIKILNDHLQKTKVTYKKGKPIFKSWNQPLNDIELSIRIICNNKNVLSDRLNFSDIDLRNLNFANVDFGQAYFENVFMQKGHFKNANLSKITFWNGNLSESNFWKADLRESYFIKVNMSKSNFSYANMSKSNFNDVNMNNSDFTRSDISQAEFKNARMRQINFLATNMKLADLSSADLYRAKNLTQKQLNEIIYEKGHPPKNVPNHLFLPKDRAYIIGKNGKKFFVKSNKRHSKKNVLQC